MFFIWTPDEYNTAHCTKYLIALDIQVEDFTGNLLMVRKEHNGIQVYCLSLLFDHNYKYYSGWKLILLKKKKLNYKIKHKNLCI